MSKGLSRRRFLALAGGGVASFLVYYISDFTIRSAGKIDLMRPPGAVVESAFEGACIRCQKCVYICPTHAIKPATVSDGLSKVLTPILDGECIYCWKCIDQCPSGALQPIDIKDYKVGNAAIITERCIKCWYCVIYCPFQAVTQGTYPIVDSQKCTGCAKCWVVCPVLPKAIAMSSEGAKRKG